MKRYEALFILNNKGKEETIPDLIERVKADLQASGAKVSSIQKLDKKQFAYRSDKLTSGYYVNYVFEAEPAIADKLKTRFQLDDEVFRVIIVNAPLNVKPLGETAAA